METEFQISMLPHGVHINELKMHNDARGTFTEVFREEWKTGISPVQWNVVRSHTNVLRGVHVHVTHDDYLILLEGHALIGLQDLRKGSPTEDMAIIIEMFGKKLSSIMIPHGVAHGFYFTMPSMHLYAVSEYWNPNDELRCKWTDPHLHIPWPFQEAHISECDARASSFKEVADKIPPWIPS